MGGCDGVSFVLYVFYLILSVFCFAVECYLVHHMFYGPKDSIPWQRWADPPDNQVISATAVRPDTGATEPLKGQSGGERQQRRGYVERTHNRSSHHTTEHNRRSATIQQTRHARTTTWPRERGPLIQSAIRVKEGEPCLLSRGAKSRLAPLQAKYPSMTPLPYCVSACCVRRPPYF